MGVELCRLEYINSTPTLTSAYLRWSAVVCQHFPHLAADHFAFLTNFLDWLEGDLTFEQGLLPSKLFSSSNFPHPHPTIVRARVLVRSRAHTTYKRTYVRAHTYSIHTCSNSHL